MAPSGRSNAFAVTAPGLEALALAELQGLGIADARAEPGGVAFAATTRSLYQVNLQSRTASRVVVRAGEFLAKAFHELERRSRRVAWSELIPSHGAVRLRVTCRKSRLYHSSAVAERVAAAISAAVPGASFAGTEGPADDDAATVAGESGAAAAQLVLVRILHDRCTISVDSSGDHLHRRGYRQALARAPLRETLGAACIMASGWPGDRPLIDPMCGSGTLVIEAALMARRMAPGRSRAFAFERWPSFDAPCWSSVRDEARSRELPAAGVPLIGADRDAGAIAAAVSNAERAGVVDDTSFVQRALSATPFDGPPGWLVSNPPYGVRVGDRAPLRDLYARLGTILRARAAGWRVTLLSADRTLDAQTGLQWTELFRTTNGGIPVQGLTTTIAESPTDFS
ncbi:MAG TPA: class I SAM-dependent RNA methyltransferase [Gemmatimonadaceae bacterium]|nr:class I SAM-dependent RNA methyltransferase [Gemmatimonadaceae bacterium]